MKEVLDVNKYDKYKIAYLELNSKLEELVSKLENMIGYKFVDHMSGRIKSNDSIEEKIRKRKSKVGDTSDFDVSDIDKYISDVVGFRIVCYFKHDLYTVVNALNASDEIDIVDKEDYIISPKPSGYTGYHITVSVPIYDLNGNVTDRVDAEIQLRTLAMDMYASLEHKIRYKKGHNFSSKECDILNGALQIVNDVDRELSLLVMDNKFLENSKHVSFEPNLDKYYDAMEKLLGDISFIENDFRELGEFNPIDHVNSRIKSPYNIYKKIFYLYSRAGYNLDSDDINDYILDNSLNDIIGIRIVCSFLSDLDFVISELQHRLQFEFGYKILKVNDYYWDKRKDNGYYGYHMVVGIPVCKNGGIKWVKAEIQVTTKAMNLWANFEHELCYHKDACDSVRGIVSNYANRICEIDEYLDSIYRRIINNDKGEVKGKKCLSKKL